MRKAFYIVMDSSQSDQQIIRELEHAVGELTSIRPETIKRIEPIQEKNESKRNS